MVTGPRQAEVVERAVPRLAPGCVRVQVEGCGACGSNVPVWEGRPWFDYPLAPGAPGHEGWGTVLEVGSPRRTIARPGARVAFLHEQAFAEQVDVADDRLVVLPPELGGRPFPGESLGCGFNVAARSGFRPGQVVAVVGAGFIGAIAVALAADAGARVIAISRRRTSLDLARTMGADEVVQLDDPGRVVAVVEDLTGSELCDVVVEAAGTQEPLDLAGALTKVRGRLVLAGFHQDGRRTVDLQLWGWRGIDVVNAHERDPNVALAGIRAAAEAVAAGRFDPSPLLTHAFGLDDLAGALDALVSRPDGFVKALVCP